jgi:D-alanyl-lipoteichoic acid acyltransferase DltB (MBOAT superfamily)
MWKGNMLFNTLEFSIFFLIVYSLYRISPHRVQNILLLIASYYFYGCWDWRFLSLIFVSTVVDYFCGIKMHQANDNAKRKFFLIASVMTNLGILGFFKYFNFFSDSFADLISIFGLQANTRSLNIILPVGISFYTFQTMSYTIDIYRRKMEPTHNFLDFALFVAFFPQLVAGPIERAKNLLPQVMNPRKITFEKFYEGTYLIFWGLFKKVFIADNLAKIADNIFSTTDVQNGFVVALGVLAFAFQIYGDFSGYSDIARGLSKVMGFELMLNFNLPYFAVNPSDFWRRWHISLSTWLKDYLYISLGGNRKGNFNTYRNLMLTMLLGGLWHGAGWTFVLWGIYQGVLLIVHRFFQPYMKKIFQAKNSFLESFGLWTRIVIMFMFANFGWLIFRAQSVEQIKNMFHSLFFNFSLTGLPEIEKLGAQILFFSFPLFNLCNSLKMIF